MSAENTNNRPQVSVVVPIYNVEKYLRECVDSILGQTLKNIEVILVDDGSPDNCGAIVDEYAKKDSRVVAVHQPNSGYSKAVNRGIDMAKGEYIGIIESDDWIEKDMYESLYKSAIENDTDTTKGCFFFYNPTLLDGNQNVIYKNGNGVDLRLAPDSVFTAKDWPQIISFHASIWSSIYKAEFVKAIKVPETVGASYQDFPFMIDVMTRAKRITVVKRGFVHWRNEPSQGNSTSARGEKLLLMAKNTINGLNILKASGQYEELKEGFYIQALWCNWGFYNRIDKKYKKTYHNLLHEVFVNLKDDKTFTYKYFKPHEIKTTQLFVKKGGYYIMPLRKSLSFAKRIAGWILYKISPSFRSSCFMKGHITDMEQTIFDMSERIKELTDLVKELKENK